MTLTKKVKRVCSFKGFNRKDRKKEKYDVQVRNALSDQSLIYSYAGDFLLDMERQEIEEKCLKQQQMIMEQMKNLKKLDTDITNIQHDSLPSIDSTENENEAERLEQLIWLTERIINIQKLQNQAEEEIRIKCRKINEIKCKRLRSLSEPVHQSSMLVTSQSFERSDSVRKRDWFNSLYTPRSKPKKDDEVKNNTLLRPYSYFKNEERDSIPEKETIWKKTFNTRILDERKTELDQSIRRSASDVAIAEKRHTKELSVSKSERKLNSCDTDSDTGVSSLHSSENDFRYSPTRKSPEKRETLV